MICTAVSIIDGDTFTVSPQWSWNGESGDTVRTNGYNTPEKGQPGYEAAKNKLKNLIQRKWIEFRSAYRITYGRLLCDVYYNGKNLKDYFPEYQKTE
jgi:endonuclease YncB( thermonuclease family)